MNNAVPAYRSAARVVASTAVAAVAALLDASLLAVDTPSAPSLIFMLILWGSVATASVAAFVLYGSGTGSCSAAAIGAAARSTRVRPRRALPGRIDDLPSAPQTVSTISPPEVIFALCFAAAAAEATSSGRVN